MYKIGASFDPEKGKMVDIWCITSTMVLKLCDSGFNAPDGRAYTVSWLGLPDTFLIQQFLPGALTGQKN